tara:strand:- start:830 stop:1387 length:558 start_codon:yes stop_codon:yes gene_type:complete
MIAYASCISALTTAGWYVMKSYTYGNYYYSRYITPFTKDIVAMIYKKTLNSPPLRCNSFRVIEEDTSKLKKIYYAPHTNSGFRFIQVMIDVNEEKYEVNLNNYMVVGNILFGDEFVKYVLEEQQGVIINNEDYVVHIIDQNVNLLTLTDDDYLIVKKGNYEIVKIDYEDSDPENMDIEVTQNDNE